MPLTTGGWLAEYSHSMDGGLGVQRKQSAPSVPARSVNAHRMGSRSSSQGLPLSMGNDMGNDFWSPAAAGNLRLLP